MGSLSSDSPLGGGPSQPGVQGELQAISWQDTTSSELLPGTGLGRSSVVYLNAQGDFWWNGRLGLSLHRWTVVCVREKPVFKVGRGLRDLTFSVEVAYEERCAELAKAGLLSLMSEAQKWCPPKKPGGVCRR